MPPADWRSVWSSRAFLLSTVSPIATFWHRMAWLAWGEDE